jgi:phosphoribosylcarboxyaminoimidazole (NCAIR) mutase
MFSLSPRDVDSIAQSPWYIPVVANSAQNKRVACMVGVDILSLRDDSSSELRTVGRSYCALGVF